ncbi:MAG TPA: ATP synthase F0 subunit B [Candidatus Acidoferrum sp.]|nr:ATP synthase F0 subunit B [Candidatus Acidoferrum sp.]
MKSFLRALCFLGWSAMVMAAPVLAQEGESSPLDTTTGWIFRWINFAVVFALIVWGFAKLGPYFRQHAREISEAIAEGTRAREAAEGKSREAQAKMAELPNEIEGMKAEAKKDSEAEILRLRAQTKEEAEKVELATQAEIAAAERAARLELKSIAAEMAVARAEALLRQRLTPQTEAALLKMYVAELEKRPDAGQAGVN